MLLALLCPLVCVAGTTEMQHKLLVDVELLTGVGMGLDCRSGDHWRSEPSLGVGANLTYPLSQKWSARAGLSGEFYSSSRKVEHPYPYVMDMRATLQTASTRLTAGIERELGTSEKGNRLLVGAALYGDIIHSASLRNKLFHVSGESRETLDIRDSFQFVTPGVMLNLGISGHTGRIGLRYWEDLRSFSVPGIPMGRQKRAYLGIGFAYNIRLPE